MKRPVVEEKGAYASWSGVVSVEMRNEKNLDIFGDRSHRIW